MYVGFEIEVEACKDDQGRSQPNRDGLYDLIEKTYLITGWSRSQGISRYHCHENMTEQGLWRVEHDASLLNGAEFVMPPVNKDTALYLLEKFFKVIESSECTTSGRCGLHLNISDNDRTLSRVNIGYFIANVNYRLLAALWPDRVKNYNTYCVGFKHILLSMITNGTINPGLNKKEQETFQRKLLDSHNNMINVRLDQTETRKKRFEIRAMGGENYHKEFEKIKTTTNMFEEVLEKSCEICKDTYTNKKIISYINRINNRQKENVWVPITGTRAMQVEQIKLVENLRSIKNIDKHGAWTFLEKLKIKYRPPRYKKYHYRSFDAYCALMLQIIDYRFFSNTQLNTLVAEKRNNVLIKFANEAVYYIVKYMSNNPTVYPPFLCNKIIKKYMTGCTKIGDTKMALTIPESEKQHDVVWLAGHMYMFNYETRQKYINMLSKHMLVFINKHKEKYGKGILRMSQKKVKELSN